MNSKLDWLYVIKRKFDLRFYARFQYIRTQLKKFQSLNLFKFAPLFEKIRPGKPWLSLLSFGQILIKSIIVTPPVLLVIYFFNELTWNEFKCAKKSRLKTQEVPRNNKRRRERNRLYLNSMHYSPLPNNIKKQKVLENSELYCCKEVNSKKFQILKHFLSSNRKGKMIKEFKWLI